MTAIGAIMADDGVVWMAGDSAGVCPRWGLTIRRDPKVFACGALLIGYTTSYRMAQLIRYGLDGALEVAHLQPPGPDGDGFRFMVRDFVPRVRHLFTAGGFMQAEKGQEQGGDFLVAWPGHLYAVCSNLQVKAAEDPYMAEGCAADLVLGSLFSSDQFAPECPRARLELAMEAAERHSAGVRGPFTIMNTADLLP